MRTLRNVLAGAGMALTLASGAAGAEGIFPGTLGGTAAFMTEYVFRGISQTDEDPAVQASLDYSVGFTEAIGGYVGLFGSNVDFNDGDEAHIEIDVYAGVKGDLSGLSWDVGGIYYAYPGAAGRLDYDFVEGKVAFGYDFDIAAVTASAFYSPDFFGGSGDAVFLLGQVSVPLPYDFGLSGTIGHQWVERNSIYGVPDYLTWSAGLTWTIKGFTLALSYYDTDIGDSRCADICGGRAVASVSTTF